MIFRMNVQADIGIGNQCKSWSGKIMSFDDYLFKLFNVDYYCMIRRKIEIAEWKLGIYNPYSTISYVDFEDNPHYFSWYSNIIDRIRIYQAAQRFGKPTFSEICFKHEYKEQSKLWTFTKQ